MDKNNYDHFFMNNEKEKDIWNNCIFIFDTSALLDFYLLSKNTQTDIFDNIFDNIRERLWIPGHVEYEYFQNRITAINKPIDKKYNEIEKEYIKLIKDNINEIKNVSKRLFDYTKNEDKHPFINSEITSNFIKECSNFNKKFEDFSKSIKDDLEEKISEIKSLESNDFVLNNFEKYFDVGEEYKFNKKMKIVEEGRKRYKNKIPPGYKDEKEKVGLQIYGDLFIWKQIIEYAKDKEKPVIFIVNDLKEDWCNIVKRSNEKRISSPRNELIREIKDEANVDFWMYNLSQFLYHAKEFLNTTVTDKSIEETKSIEKEFKENTAYLEGILTVVNEESYVENSIQDWLKKNYQEYRIEDNMYDNSVDIELFDKSKNRIGVLIKHIHERLTMKDFYKLYNKINYDIDFLYKFNSFEGFLVFIVGITSKSDIFIPDKLLNKLKEKNIEIVFGYIGDDKTFKRIS